MPGSPSGRPSSSPTRSSCSDSSTVWRPSTNGPTARPARRCGSLTTSHAMAIRRSRPSWCGRPRPSPSACSTRERDIRAAEEQLRDAALATERAKAAVAANAEQLRRHVADRERLLSTLDQAKMQESINAALDQISGPAGELVPTLAEVERKIEARLARAEGRAELTAASSDPLDLQMLEIEQSQRRSGAQARLEEMRIALGLATPGDRRRLRRAEGARPVSTSPGLRPAPRPSRAPVQRTDIAPPSGWRGWSSGWSPSACSWPWRRRPSATHS